MFPYVAIDIRPCEEKRQKSLKFQTRIFTTNIQKAKKTSNTRAVNDVMQCYVCDVSGLFVCLKNILKLSDIS